MIIPLEVNAQYYVYEFYSPAQFTWFYNETHTFWGRRIGPSVSAAPSAMLIPLRVTRRICLGMVQSTPYFIIPLASTCLSTRIGTPR